MQLHLKTLVAAVGLALGSTCAMAQVVTVPTDIAEPTPNSDTDNGGLIFTLFSVNDATPWSYSYSLGLRMDQVLESSSDMATDGKSLTWVLPNLNEVGNVADLRWHVTAGDAGNARTTARYLTTADVPDTGTIAPNNGQVINAASSQYFNFVSALNAVAGTPDITTDPTDPRFAAGNYGVTSNIFAFNTAGSVGSALAFFLLTNQGISGTAAASVDRYESLAGSIGHWTIDLAANTLTWNVAPVPLPAAVWLLLSALGGMGAVARGRRAA